MSATDHVKRIKSRGPDADKLEAWPAMDPANLESGTPVQSGCFYDEDAATDYSVGIWECTAFIDRPGPYPVDEFMLLLEGSVEMVMPDGTSVTVNPGEAFVIPKGLECQWKMPGTVRKIFMILDGDAPGRAHNASLGRITVPPLAGQGAGAADALVTRDVHFLNHDRGMRVHIERYSSALNGPAPRTGRHLVHVLEGSVAFDGPGDAFGPGDSFYLMPGSNLGWDIAAGTRLLTACCDLPAH